jgi:hypothetical protein
MTTVNSNKISKQTFEILEQQSFPNHPIKESSDDLDSMYFSFMKSENPSDFERTSATYAYFSIKKLLQSVKDQTDPSNLSAVSVDISFYAG